MEHNPDFSNNLNFSAQYELENHPNMSEQDIINLIIDNIPVSSNLKNGDKYEATLTRFRDKRSGYGLIKSISYPYLPMLNEIDPSFNFDKTKTTNLSLFTKIMNNWLDSIEGNDDDYVPYQAYQMFCYNLIGLLGLKKLNISWYLNFTNKNGYQLEDNNLNLPGNKINNRRLYFSSYRITNNTNNYGSFKEVFDYFTTNTSTASCILNNLQVIDELKGVYSIDYNLPTNDTGVDKNITIYINLKDSNYNLSQTIEYNLIQNSIKNGLVFIIIDPVTGQIINVLNLDEEFNLKGFSNSLSSTLINLNNESFEIGLIISNNGEIIDNSNINITLDNLTLTRGNESINLNWLTKQISNDLTKFDDSFENYLPNYIEDKIVYSKIKLISNESNPINLYGITKNSALNIKVDNTDYLIKTNIQSNYTEKFTEFTVNNGLIPSIINDSLLASKWNNLESSVSNLINLNEEPVLIGSYNSEVNPSKLGIKLNISNNDVSLDTMDSGYIILKRITSKEKLSLSNHLGNEIIGFSRNFKTYNDLKFPDETYEDILIKLDDLEDLYNKYGFIETSYQYQLTIALSNLSLDIYPYNYYTLNLATPDFSFNWPLWTLYLSSSEILEDLHPINEIDDKELGNNTEYKGCYKLSTIVNLISEEDNMSLSLTDLLDNNKYNDNTLVYIITNTDLNKTIQLLVPYYVDSTIECTGAISNLSINNTNTTLGGIWNCGFLNLEIKLNPIKTVELFDIKLSPSDNLITSINQTSQLGKLYHGYGLRLSKNEEGYFIWQLYLLKLDILNTKSNINNNYHILVLVVNNNTCLNNINKYTIEDE